MIHISDEGKEIVLLEKTQTRVRTFRNLPLSTSGKDLSFERCDC